MDCEEILSRVELPIYTEEGIQCCVNDCLKENKKGEKGQNMAHRNMKLSSYRNYKKSRDVTIEDRKNFMCDIIRYLANSLYLEYSSSSSFAINNEELISNVDHDFIIKNLDLKDMKVNQLSYISNLTNEELLNYLESGSSNISLFIRKAYESMSLWQKDGPYFAEHVCANPIYPYTIPDDNAVGIRHGGDTLYSKRIHINGAKDIRELQFIFELLKKCIDKRIPCDMKPFFSTGLDGTVLYSTNENFGKQLEALEETIDEHPELLDSIGSPILSGANVRSADGNCYYAIAHGGADIGKGEKPSTYNNKVDRIINVTYTIACLKLIKYYWAAVFKECPDHIKELLHKDFNSLNDFLAVIDKEKEIRGLAYNIIQRQDSNDKEHYNKLTYFFKQNFGMVTSLFNFADLDHIETPIYKDESFLQFENNGSNNRKAK